MKSNINETELKYYSTIPSVWGGVIGYQYATTHYEDGWRDVVEPYDFDPKLHKLGEMYYDEANDVVTYEVIEKTVEEIESEVMAQAKFAQEEALMAIKNSKILSEIQEFEDEDALQNQSAYPLWEADVYVALGEKRQDLDANNELKLYKCVQAHTTQADWRPKDTPALWTRVGYDDEILDWVQPLGAHDAYNTGDKVKHNGFVWTSKVDGNVWEPTEANSTLWEKGDEI